MNTFHLIKVKEAILQNPQHFDMEMWECGTTACIGGWALRLAGVDILDLNGNGDSFSYRNEAAKILKLTHAESARLFYEDQWPRQFQSKYGATAQQAADRIDHFVATEGRE